MKKLLSLSAALTLTLLSTAAVPASAQETEEDLLNCTSDTNEFSEFLLTFHSQGHDSCHTTYTGTFTTKAASSLVGTLVETCDQYANLNHVYDMTLTNSAGRRTTLDVSRKENGFPFVGKLTIDGIPFDVTCKTSKPDQY